jgi:hypothetical protein
MTRQVTRSGSDNNLYLLRVKDTHRLSIFKTNYNEI